MSGKTLLGVGLGIFGIGVTVAMEVVYRKQLKANGNPKDFRKYAEDVYKHCTSVDAVTSATVGLKKYYETIKVIYPKSQRLHETDWVVMTSEAVTRIVSKNFNIPCGK